MKLHHSIAIPAKVRPGDEVKAKDYNLLIDALIKIIARSEKNQVRSSADVGVKLSGADGTLLYVKSPKGRGASGGKYEPWQPRFFTTGTAPSLVYKCRINLGTVNNVAASNWNAEHALPSDDAIKFVVLTITTASGKVTGVSISIDAVPPTDDVIAKDTPPVSHKIVLGAIGKQTAQMIVTTNLNLFALEVFRETVAAPATGAEPFSRWWRWTPE